MVDLIGPGEKLKASKAKINAQYKALDDRISKLVADAGNSNMEIVDARGGFPLLRNRLENYDEELNDIPNQPYITEKATQEALNTTNNAVALKADKSYVDTQISSVASGSPKGVYATLAALQAAFPTGDPSIYLVTADGKWYYWNGSAWTPGGTYQSTGIADLGIANKNYAKGSITPEKLSFLTQLPNLIDKTRLSAGKLVNASGVLVANASYDSSDYIPIENGKTYTFSAGIRYICDYDLSKTFKTVVTSTSYQTTPFTFTATRDGYILASWFATNTKNIVMQEGTTADENKNEYGFKFDNSKVKTDYPVPYDLIVKKEGEIYYLRSPFDSTNDIVIKTTKSGSSNGSFNFLSTKLIAKTSSSYEVGTLIHDNADDITPVRLPLTVGANHGYPCIISISMAGHGKTTADLGSRWTDGTTVYTLLDISGNNLILGCPYTEANGLLTVNTVQPVANLTHVSGATNTAAIDVTTKNASPQLYPSINNKSLKYILDGVEITADGVYYGKDLQVQESYNVMDYKAIIDFAQANIGVSYKNDNVAGAVKLSIVFRFTKGCNCLISHNFKALRKLSLLDCGFTQSVVLNPPSNTKVFRYLPNVKVKGGIDFKNIVDMSTYGVTTAFAPADLINAQIPPNRYVDWIKDNATGNKVAGFTAGYIPDKTNSKNSDRLASSGFYWDMRDTKKSYPIAMRDIILNANDYKTFLLYRCYLAPEQALTATNINVVEDKKDTYVYIDYHTNVTGRNVKLDKHIGKSITVVDSENFTLHNDVVDSDGVTFSISNNYGYAILKLS